VTLSRSDNVWDNVAMESFFSSLKTGRTAALDTAGFADELDLAEGGFRPTNCRASTFRCRSLSLE